MNTKTPKGLLVSETYGGGRQFRDWDTIVRALLVSKEFEPFPTEKIVGLQVMPDGLYVKTKTVRPELQCPNCGAVTKSITTCGTEATGYSRGSEQCYECLDCHICADRKKFQKDPNQKFRKKA